MINLINRTSKTRALTLWLVATGVTVSGCAILPAHVEDPGINIETLSGQSVSVIDASFWRNGSSYSLRGEIVSVPRHKRSFSGHIDIELSSPDGADLECRTVRIGFVSSIWNKTYWASFDTLPDRGSNVRVWYHEAEQTHSGRNACPPPPVGAKVLYRYPPSVVNPTTSDGFQSEFRLRFEPASGVINSFWRGSNARKSSPNDDSLTKVRRASGGLQAPEIR